MTDNEIIKALKVCCSDDTSCEGCPLEDLNYCGSIMHNSALRIIKQQETEIEKLQDYNANLLTANTALSNEILEIKSEAIKEFAERLKKELPKCDYVATPFNVGYDRTDVINLIDNLVKEMTEE